MVHFRLSLQHLWGILVAGALLLAPDASRAGGTQPPIYIAFLWHMHQPIYWPYESIVQTDALGRYDYSVTAIHEQRFGPYTTWPWDAVQKGIDAGLGTLGTQVSFSGSLVKNLDALQANGNATFATWKNRWLSGMGESTKGGNPRIDLVGFGYHHPLMALIEGGDIQRQIQLHRSTIAELGGGASRGIFPPENAFSEKMIPALAAEDLQWVMVDNIHFDRACAGYPYSTAGNLVEANRADIVNPDPGDWISLTGLWAPTPISARFGHRPHWVESIDPSTADASRIIAVPTDRYMGNEDGRGGFGALNYEDVMSQLEPYNDDPSHPLLIVLHHDGDNFGGGSDSYYHNNFQAFVDWLVANPQRFVCTTVQDYLDRFPPASDDLIHVENGSWSGAGNGDPEFSKWLGDPAPDGTSPDRNSWAVMTAARNEVMEAEAADPAAEATSQAWRFFLNSQASDYWYWDGAQDGVWDSHPTRATNQAVTQARLVPRTLADEVAPSLFFPQREPYNPGATEWTLPQPCDFEVWTLAYDTRGLFRVRLFYRNDLDGMNPLASHQNENYASGNEVGTWAILDMSASQLPPASTDPLPLVRAQRYSTTISGLSDVLVDYYVEAEDLAGNLSRSPIEHVYVGNSGQGGGGFTLDGELDGAAQELGSAGGVTLYAAIENNILYVATESAGAVDEDVFVLIAHSPGVPLAAPWAKSGQVAAWDAYLGNESTNSWSGWFEISGEGASAVATILEGTLDLNGEFGALPDTLFLAVARYQTGDGGVLSTQFPPGNGDGNVDAGEFLPYPLLTPTAVEGPRRPAPWSLQAYPNPFNPHTTVSFTLPEAAFARLDLLDVRGRCQRTLLEERLGAGRHSLRLEADGLASGVYFVRLSTPDGDSTRKIVLAR